MIDLKAKTITGKSGTVYRIDPENISAGRWHHYIIMSTAIGAGVAFQEVFDGWAKMHKAVTTGNDIIKALTIVRQECEEKMQFIDKYKTNTAPKLIEFCALFCIAEGEDVGEYNDALVEKKFNDWRHIPIMDFQVLSSMVIPGFRESYQKVLAGESEIQ